MYDIVTALFECRTAWWGVEEIHLILWLVHWESKPRKTPIIIMIIIIMMIMITPLHTRVIRTFAIAPWVAIHFTLPLLRHWVDVSKSSSRIVSVLYCPVFCDMRTGNWGHGKSQAVPTVSSYTVLVHHLCYLFQVGQWDVLVTSGHLLFANKIIRA